MDDVVDLLVVIVDLITDLHSAQTDNFNRDEVIQGDLLRTNRRGNTFTGGEAKQCSYVIFASF